MICPSCGAESRAEARFCARCGSPLSASCPGCGAPARSDDRFCTQCGHPLTGDARHARDPAAAGAPAGPAGRAAPGADGTAPAGAAGVPAPRSERRLVSVLFVDLVGFTPFSEARDHEEVREVLSRYFARSRSIVERHGGVVEKFIGDAILAIWGVPAIHEDDAERAVRAGLEVVEAVADLGASLGTELAARAGVLTGEAAITQGAAFEEGRVAGDLVNTASRLQTSAEPGTVVVGEATFHAAAGAISFAEIGELTLKGKEEPVRAWRALRVVAQRRGVGRSEAIDPPFVGRAEELRLLKDALDAIGRERRPRLVSVTGIPGIGKSRLAWEFLKYVDGLAEDVFWHQGRSPSYGEGISFWALGEMVRMRAGISEGEDVASARDKLSACLARFVADDEDRRWIGPRLAHLLGLAEAPAGGRDELFSSWRRFFELVAEEDPVVMVFEDLQWADAGLIDFVESILEWSRHSPILVVALARPELLDKRPSWGAGQRNFTAVHLEPLPDAAMRELLKGVVRDLPAPAVEQVLARAEGVPLYAVETVRMLLDRGLLAERGGSYELTGEWAARAAADLEIPDSLRALVASRLDALEPGERSLLRDASVLGQSFSAAALAALAAGGAPGGHGSGGEASPAPAAVQQLEPRLRVLVRKELLSLDTDPRSPGRGQYAFVQGLMREVAYSMLARRDRQARHLAAAAYFESLGEEELAGVVATHYAAARAAALDGDEQAQLGELAARWLARAGERALALGSSEQALAYFEQALELVAAGTERSRLLELAGDAADRAAAYERACELYLEAIAGHEAAGDAGQAGRLTAALAHSLVVLDRITEAVSRLRRALEALGESGDVTVRSRLWAEVGRDLTLSGEPAAGLAELELALSLAEAAGDDGCFRRALGGRAVALSRLGRRREAAIVVRATAELAERAGDLYEQARSLINLGVVIQPDDPRAALRAYEQAVAVSRRLGSRGSEVGALSNTAESAVYLGDLASAGRLVSEIGERREQLGPSESLFLRTLEAVLLALSSDPVAGRDALRPVVERSARAEFVDARTTMATSWAFVELLAGDLDEAFEGGMAAAAIDPLGANSPLALAVACRAALWLGDAARARRARHEMELLHGAWMAALRATADAGIAALAGAADAAGEPDAAGAAAAGYVRAVQLWRDLSCPLDLALCLLDELRLLPAAALAAGTDREAAALIEQIGSPTLRAELERALAAAGTSTQFTLPITHLTVRSGHAATS